MKKKTHNISFREEFREFINVKGIRYKQQKEELAKMRASLAEFFYQISEPRV